MSTGEGDATTPSALREPRRILLMRRIMIESLKKAQASMLPVTIGAEARVDGLVDVHRRLRGVDLPRLTIGTVIAKLLVTVLMDFPFLNTTITDDNTLIEHPTVNLGIGVALDDGELVVPVLHNAEALSLGELAEALGDLIGAARARRLSVGDVRGGALTLSNVGMVSSLAVPFTATPLIPPGQVGTVLAGAIRDAPVVDEGALIIGKVMPLAFSFDHRIVNGIPSLTAFGEFVRRLNDPTRWL